MVAADDQAINEDDKYLTVAQARVRVDQLTSADLKRLALFARWLISDNSIGMSPDDIVSQAYVKILTGERRVPSAFPLMTVFTQIMRSIVSNALESADVNALRFYDPANFNGAAEENGPLNPLLQKVMAHAVTPELTAMYAQATEELSKMFPEERERELYEARHLAGEKPEAIRKAMAMSQTEYDSRMRNIRRKRQSE